MPIETKSRDLSLDFLKAWAIFLVVYFHNAQLNPDSFLDNLSMLFPYAAVPCFFMVSGAVFFHRPFTMKKHISRMVRFYLVMVLWKAIYLAFYVSQGVPFSASLRKLCSYLFLFQSWEGVGTAHFWFMEAMLTLMLAAPLLYFCFHHTDTKDTAASRHLLWYLLIVLLLFNQIVADGGLLMNLISKLTGKPNWDVSTWGEINPFSFRHSNYFTYYLLGGLLIENKNRLSARKGLCMTVLGVLGLLVIKYLQTGSWLWQDTFLQSGYYWISTMLLACGLFLSVLHLKLPETSIPGQFAKVAGSSTLGVFYLHIPLIFCLTPVLFEPLSTWNCWLINTAETLLICLIALLITRIGKRIPGIRYLFQ